MDPVVWMQYAASDLRAAQSGSPDLEPRHLCFFAQQAAEKAIKAALIVAGIEFPKWHDVDALRGLLPPDWTLVHQFTLLGALTAWAVAGRYADSPFEPSVEQAQEATSLARGVFDAVERELRGRGIEL
jgi:HEPN domain-containing protein